MKMATTGAHFVATLPASMTDDQLLKVVEWSKQACVKSDVTMRCDGRCELVAESKKKKTAREFQRNIRTNMLNWGMDLPSKQTGWLRIVSEEEFNDILRPSPRIIRKDNHDSETSPVMRQPYKGLQLPVNLLTRCH